MGYISITTHSKRGTEKLKKEYVWLFENAVRRGREKDMRKLEKWYKSHYDNIRFHDDDGNIVDKSVDVGWMEILVAVATEKEARKQEVEV